MAREEAESVLISAGEALRTGLTPDVADRLDVLMSPVSDREMLIRPRSIIFARALAFADYEAAWRSAMRRAMLDPDDHRPWLDVAAAREKQGALTGALETLGRAHQLDAGVAQAARDRVRLRLRLRLN